ncbi:folylpolyglutamate synthase/dihydrofolate synthase family protein [Sphingomonas sp.]|uniref:bifunctional folylpolyglutamate synthase/dihydrofolate synthase n=1 Tax=Sphingomonas sp. TaxID=28214 RepID=UPI002ED97E52
MPDHATSSDAGVQAQLDRLWALSPGADVLGLERITRLLTRLGNPERHLPPVFHVAGTNGKGSTCAFLRGTLEAAGHRVHVYSSPHLVRFNERIRLAGTLIGDRDLASLLGEILDQADGIGASFFEVTTAAAFLAFARTPADACVIEVGLGGRLDATNVVVPLVTGIAALGIDHEAFLGDTLVGIAGEKAGIAKRDVPLVTMDYPAPLADRIAQVAAAVGAPVFARGAAWTSSGEGGRLSFNEFGYAYEGPLPSLTGDYQADNFALALAMIRRQQALVVPDAALHVAAETTRWPARLQRLGEGPLASRFAVPRGIWVDGAHNPSAAGPVAAAWKSIAAGKPTALVIGMLANKDADAVLALLTDVGAPSHVVAVPVAGHPCHTPETLAGIARSRGAQASTAPTLAAAIDLLSAERKAASVLIAGSLYLAGEALAANAEPPS